MLQMQQQPPVCSSSCRGARGLDTPTRATPGAGSALIRRGQCAGDEREWRPVCRRFVAGPVGVRACSRAGARPFRGLSDLHVRHGTTTLFAAFNVADGTVITSTHRRHRASEFKKFLAKIDGQVPAHLAVHVVCDNYGTHKHPTIKAWLASHPRFTLHFTPTYSSWLNQVERWFAYVTGDLLQRSDHRSIRALEADLRAWAKAWNVNPRPFIWTKTAEDILASLGRLIARIKGEGH